MISAVSEAEDDVTTRNPTEDESGAEFHTTDVPCVMCVTTTSLDDEQSKLGTVRWQVTPYFGLKRGKAIAFHCAQGHSSEADPELLRAFPSRTF